MLTTASGQRALVPGGGGGQGDGEGGGADGVDVGQGQGEHEDEAESEGDAMLNGGAAAWLQPQYGNIR